MRTRQTEERQHTHTTKNRYKGRRIRSTAMLWSPHPSISSKNRGKEREREKKNKTKFVKWMSLRVFGFVVGLFFLLLSVCVCAFQLFIFQLGNRLTDFQCQLIVCCVCRRMISKRAAAASASAAQAKKTGRNEKEKGKKTIDVEEFLFFIWGRPHWQNTNDGTSPNRT